MSDYDVFLVDCTKNRRLSHVYALKKDLGISESFYGKLLLAFDEKTHRSYYEMKPKLIREQARNWGE